MEIKITKQKVNQQLRLENEAVEEAILRYNNMKNAAYSGEKDVTTLLPENILMRRAIEPTALSLKEYLKPKRGGSRIDRCVKAKEILKTLDVYELAYIAAREAFNHNVGGLQSLCIRVGKKVEGHHDYLRFKSQYGGFVFVVEQNFKTMNRAHRASTLNGLRDKFGVERSGWDYDLKMSIGQVLLNQLVSSTGMFKIVRGSKQKKGYMKNLEMTPEARKYAEDIHSKCSLLNPTKLPMVVPPKDWINLNEGGFLSLDVDLIRSRDKRTRAIAAQADLSMVFKVINSIQKTPWRINRRVLEVLEEARHTGLGGLPVPDLEATLPAPLWSNDEEYITLKKEQPEVVKKWIASRADAYNRWHRETSKRIALNTKVRVAKQFLEEEAIWFAWNMDWRGRIYCIQNCFIHPQSDDTGKSLIEFAEGKEIGAEGVYWLAVHGSNCYGNDKVSFDERHRWVLENEEEIIASANAPFENRFWCDADEPYMFLAFCFEWAEYKKVGESFISHLPVNMDGSCSGLQHFSALLKDEKGGQAVNLIPSEKPSDIYQQVADVSNKIITGDVIEGNKFAKMWMGKVNRSWTKRNTMTAPYSATHLGFLNQILEELKKKDAESGESYIGDRQAEWHASDYLARVNKESIKSVVVKAAEAMEWLQKIADILAKNNLPIMWTTPTGFKVYQGYRTIKTKRIETLWGETKVVLSLVSQGKDVSTGKQKAGISPNYIHSLDASHLVLTVERCLEEGISDFSMIHDSFGCHACDVPKLNRILRETFTEMYSSNLLEVFLEEVKSQIPNQEVIDELPDPPSQGDLDLDLVKQSLYFFA